MDGRAPARRPAPASDVTAFGYAAGVAPMMWAFVAVALVELLVSHLLLAHWWPRVAIFVSVVSAAGMLWLVLQIRSFARCPVTIGAGVVRFRTGTMAMLDIPVADIAGLRSAWTAEVLKRDRIRNLALIAYPNIVVDFRTPRGRRRIRGVAHRLDDPDGFRRMLLPLLAAAPNG